MVTASEPAAVTSSPVQTCPWTAASREPDPSALHSPGGLGPSCWRGNSLPVAEAVDRQPWVWRGKEPGPSPASSIRDSRPSDLHERGCRAPIPQGKSPEGTLGHWSSQTSNFLPQEVRVKRREGKGSWILDRSASLLGYVLLPGAVVTERARSASEVSLPLTLATLLRKRALTHSPQPDPGNKQDCL